MQQLLHQRWAGSAKMAESLERKPSPNLADRGNIEVGECATQNAPGLKIRPQDSFSWTTLIRQYTKCGQSRQAIVAYEEMRKDGVTPSTFTFVAVLKACSSLKDMEVAKTVHAEVVSRGFELDTFVGTMLIDVYVKCGNLVDATRVFEKMPHRDVVSWNAMILGYAQMREGAKALQLYTRMQQEGLVPNDRTFVGALKACSSLAAQEEGNDGGVKRVKKCLEQVRVIHSGIVKAGSASNVFLGNMLVDVYAKCGSLEDSRRVFETMPHRDVVAWNAMILGYSSVEGGEVALDLYKRMQQEGLLPDHRTFVGILKACISLASSKGGDEKCVQKRCLEQVAAIHSDILKSGCESNMFVGNLLVDVYAKSGSIVAARHFFDSMPQRNVVSWTTMILAYAQMGQGEVGLQLYSLMQQEGVVPDDRAFVGALKACSSALEQDNRNDRILVRSSCLERVRAIHSDILKRKLELDLYMGTMLVDVYAKCGSLIEARKVFEAMPCRNLVAWNAIILGYAQMEEGAEALQLYARMQQEGLMPDERTFIGVLKACSSAGVLQEEDEAAGEHVKKRCLEQVKSIHSDIVKSGFEADVYLGNVLVDMYAKSGSLVEARSVFEKMPCRDVVAWNAIILGYAQTDSGKVALDLYKRMKMEGLAPNERTLVATLKACSSLVVLNEGKGADGSYWKPQQVLEQVKSIHLDVVQSGCESSVFVANMLVDVYAKCGSLVDAMQVFEKIPQRNVISWTAIILAYAKSGEGDEALTMYSEMKKEGIAPDVRAFIAALMACSNIVSAKESMKGDGVLVKLQCLKQVSSIHSEIVEGQFHMDVFVGTMLIDLYSKCGSLVDARSVFEKMPCHDVAAWNAMILAYAQSEEEEEALQLYVQMKEEGVVPDDGTFRGVLKACSRMAEREQGIKLDGKCVKERCLKQVRAIHTDVANSGHESHMIVGNMLVDLYAKCGSLADARNVFETTPDCDVVSWNAMIFAYAQMDQSAEALRLYARMQREGMLANERTFVGVLKACGNMADLEKGREIHAQISASEAGVTDPFIANTLIDMYAKCGSMADAMLVFESMPARDVVTWSALIAGYTRQGESQVVFDLFQNMIDAGIQPNETTFLSVLTLCSHAGLVDKGHEYFVAMSKDHCIPPTLQHYICMVDLLGRAGHLDKAMEMVQKMPFQADSVVWRCLLAACQKWRNVELGRQAFESAVSLDKNDAAAYVLMSNIYAAAERWEDAKEVQALRRKVQARKQPGQSWWTDQIGIVHAFSVGQNGHTKSKDTCDELQDLGGMNKQGYSRIIDEGSGEAAACDKAGRGSLEGGSSHSEFRNQNAVNSIAHLSDSYSWTSLIQQYSKSGQGRQALGVYVEMKRGGVKPSSYSIVAALKACSMIRDLKAAKQIHTDVIENGFQSHVYVGTMLVDTYAKCGSLVDARHIFEKMPHRDVVSWNAMIVGYAQNQEGAQALQLYGLMQQEGVVPNDRTFVGALKACSSLATLEEGDEGDREQAKKWCLNEVRAIHSDTVKGKFESDVFVGNVLVDAYAKCGSLLDARSVFEAIPRRNVISWTAMIFAYAQMEEGEVALELYTRMQQEGVVPDGRAFVGALKACSVLLTLEEAANKGDGIAARKRCVEQVRSIHSEIVKLQYQCDAFVVTMLLDVYAKCGSLVDARAVFEKMHRPDVASWNAMILGYAQMEEGEEALKLFERMQKEGVIPEERTFVAALKACGVVAALEKGKEIHAQISETGFGACDLFVPNTLIDMYGRCGSMADAQQVFDGMATRDIVTWSALIAGYARGGETHTVFQCFQQMRDTGVQPNGITFLSLLTVCSHAGLVEEGQKYFQDMTDHYGISPAMEHYICMVGLLGRAGQLERAMEMVKAMPFQPDSGVWKTLLGACRKWSNMELGIQAFECAVSLDTQDASAYVLMSNIYTDACMWQNVKEIQGMKEKMRAWKQPGQSWWTDISGIVHAFVVGDQDHPESQHTYAKLGDLCARLQEEGYCLLHLDSLLPQRPDDDEGKSLCGLSDHLAAAYALIAGGGDISSRDATACNDFVAHPHSQSNLSDVPDLNLCKTYSRNAVSSTSQNRSLG